MLILALDVGAYTSVTCLYEAETAKADYGRIATTKDELCRLFENCPAERLVLEIGPQAGWIVDLAKDTGLAVEVANANHEGWRWRKVKRKTDRADALKLAQLSAMNQLPSVHVPNARMRQWRHFIRFRHTLVRRRIAVKNQIRSILLREGIRLPKNKRGWNQSSLQYLKTLSAPVEKASFDELWRAQLSIALNELTEIEAHIQAVEKKLDDRSRSDDRVALLQTVPGVGPRLAEMVVAMIDDPHRFTTARQVASYAGLTPKQYESGPLQIRGRISKQGDGLLRMMLVEIGWLGLRHNPWIREVYERTRRGTGQRNKLAIVAVARRLLIRCWAMLRDGTCWHGHQPNPV